MPAKPHAAAADMLFSPANMYTFLREALLERLGEPTWRLTYPGHPRGFTVARHARDKRSRVIADWCLGLRTLLDHHYEVDHLLASEQFPIFIHTEAWFESRRHCDPENVGKLARDVMFYLSPRGSGKDKYTGGSHAGPLYDKLQPRTELWMWRIASAEMVKSEPREHRPIVRKPAEPGKIRKMKNPFEGM